MNIFCLQNGMRYKSATQLCCHRNLLSVSKNTFLKNWERKTYPLGGDVLKLVIIKSHKNKTTLWVFGFIVVSID